MVNHPNRSQSARKTAQAAGYFVYEGEFRSAPDNVLGRWYVGHISERDRRPWGKGFGTQREAWEAALDHHAQVTA